MWLDARSKKLGLFDPLSEDMPTDTELQHSEQLIEVLKGFGLYEAKEESIRRERVLGTLDMIVQNWVREVLAQEVQSVDRHAWVMESGACCSSAVRVNHAHVLAD